MTEQLPDVDKSALWRVLQVTRDLHINVELDESLHQVVDAALEVLCADRATVFLYDENTDELYSKIATGSDEIRFPATVGIAGECASQRIVINVPDCYNDERFNQEVDKKTGYYTNCLLTIPLVGHGDRLVGVLQVLNKKDGVFNEADEEIGQVLATQCAVALQRARFVESMLVRQKLEQDLAVARDIQNNVLPKTTPKFEGYDVAGWAQPAEETGGDIYDLIKLDEERLFLMLGDATGHGVGPALSITQVRAMVRMAMRLDADLAGTFKQINAQLSDDLPDDRFVTSLMGVLNSKTHELNYFAGGQGPMLHVKAASGDVASYDASTIPMGIIAESDPGEAVTLSFGVGDFFVLMSDGVYEAADENDDLFGKERVCELILNNLELSAAGMIEKIRETIDTYTNGQPPHDDVTIVLVKRVK